ncbi:hypothetical protein TKK_0016167 [Trichogramma kaykai]|uniref:Reverse transcriptase domain-containing protein n=1 Tax=Trichogramma kaykai TaxID=54128 RepID=A0ABD2WAJ9_9HYME
MLQKIEIVSTPTMTSAPAAAAHQITASLDTPQEDHYRTLQLSENQYRNLGLFQLHSSLATDKQTTEISPAILISVQVVGQHLCREVVSGAAVAVMHILQGDPLPMLEDLFVKLSGATIFSQLDLDQAFTHLCIDEEASHLLAIDTIKGLFAIKRFLFGISAAPGIFQRLIEELLTLVDGVAVLIDDILVASRSVQEHAKKLTLVLDILHKHRLKLKQSKWECFAHQVEILGNQIDASGIHPLPDEIDAVCKAPAP